MFFDRIIPKKYFVKQHVCAIELCFGENALDYYYAVLKNSKNRVTMDEFGSCKTVDSLPVKIKRQKMPVVLIFNGKGILHKKVQLSGETATPQSALKLAFPAVNPDEFFAQTFFQDDGSAYVVVCRKVQVRNTLLMFNSSGYDIAGVYIGVAAIPGLKPLWNETNVLETSLHKIILAGNSVNEIAQAPGNAGTGKVTFGALSFEPFYTLGFAAGLSYLMQRPAAISTDEELKSYGYLHSDKNKFRFLAAACIGLAFAVAVTNVVFFTAFFDKNNRLESELSVYQDKYDKISQLLAGYQKNKELIENAGILGNNSLSEYSDRIGQTIPEEVTLSELYFNPKHNDDESADSLLTFDHKRVVLKGNCSKSLVVNEWLNVLKMQPFIKSAALRKFTYNNESMLPNFEISLVTQ